MKITARLNVRQPSDYCLDRYYPIFFRIRLGRDVSGKYVIFDHFLGMTANAKKWQKDKERSDDAQLNGRIERARVRIHTM